MEAQKAETAEASLAAIFEAPARALVKSAATTETKQTRKNNMGKRRYYRDEI